MKKHIIAFITLFAILGFSCNKEEPKGGWVIHGVYILQNEELVPAHGYTIEIPSKEGSAELQLVAQEISRIRLLEKGDAITVELLTDCKSEDAVVYDYLIVPSDGDYFKIPRFIQILRINAEVNNNERSRTMKFRVETTSGIPESVDMTVRQDGI